MMMKNTNLSVESDEALHIVRLSRNVVQMDALKRSHLQLLRLSGLLLLLLLLSGLFFCMYMYSRRINSVIVPDSILALSIAHYYHAYIGSVRFGSVRPYSARFYQTSNCMAWQTSQARQLQKIGPSVSPSYRGIN